ncbi:general secretion pathway protein E [Peptoclostridium acidaminophilum DSM 3953]|uniref:General secretion pathway protein E n=1 Tax=Peptoclostridium acidaminophilum DSM 3953 TaxID=1286171 RepID=W8TKS7_PEPAC|nr:GspE/PulE family protein [Peptoclostridium acidaminophilum]AHM56807.1 general secretion pathway protein E [Peptoclostridium acidaminophilum DSM 3953]
MDIAEKRIPQDGRVVKTLGESEYDLRIATIATVFGEKAVIRILEKDEFRFSLNNIGIKADDAEKIKSCLSGTGGMILISGPTGSGKTTTLYSILNFIKKDSKNIITVEDPVEYTIGEVSQIQVNRQIGLDFAEGLRAALRHDPDVIMIGEIRDTETASIAMRAAITGHLVLSTIHTNDSASTVTRLMNMGIPPYIISASLKCVIAQRLVRKLCDKCKSSCKIAVAEKAALYMADCETEDFHSARGCSCCSGTGYHGRMGVYELLYIDRDLREAITQGQPQQRIRDMANEKGMATMLENAASLVIDGTTSMDEISQLLVSRE